MDYTLTTLSIEEITNLYLYGQLTKPADLTSGTLIRPPEVTQTVNIVHLDAVSFMASGPGRFANRTMSPFVDAFMSGQIKPFTGVAQTFTFQEIADLLEPGKLPSQQGFFSLHQSNYVDGVDDHALRTYIYNSENFRLSPDAVFCIDADGTRHIQNLAILPGDDDFDFVGGGLAAVGNFFLEPYIDPSAIGRRVDIKFDSSSKDMVPRLAEYTQLDYTHDISSYVDTYSPVAGTAMLTYEMPSLALNLFNSGITKFLDNEGRPILYGTVGANTLSADFTFANYPLLFDYKANGVRLIGGAGSDVLVGGDSNDVLDGGSESDTLTGGAGNDSMLGGSGYDTYNAGTGDVITDSDGAGTVSFDGTTLSGGTRKKGETIYKSQDGNYSYLWSGGDLTINGTITVASFSNNDLGIHLDEDEDPAKPPKPPVYDPNKAHQASGSPLALDLNNNGRIDDISLENSTVYFDLTQDGIAEKSGWITPDDGLLALDFNGNGVIDDRGELFGTQPGYTALGWLGNKVDANQDGVVNADDPLFGALRVWQDANSDGISQASELKPLTEYGITSISTVGFQVAQPTVNGNNIIEIGSYVRNGQEQYMADIEFSYNPVLTDANPNRPFDQPLMLDSDVYQLPWLRGYGDVPSLYIAYQNNPTLRQAASDLIAQGREGILQNFETFMAKWTGLEAAHQAQGVTRTDIVLVDKVWMLETMTGQNVQRGAIETAGFYQGTRPSTGDFWNWTYIEAQWQALMQQAAISFAIQATAKDWIKGAYYSVVGDRFVVSDAAMLQDSLIQSLAAVDNEQDAIFAAVTLDRLYRDGCDLQAAILKPSLTSLPYSQMYEAAIDGRFAFRMYSGSWSVFNVPDAQDWWVEGSGGSDWLYGNGGNDTLVGGAGNDLLSGGAGNDTLVGGAGNDLLSGGAGNDTYQFGRGDGHDSINSYDTTDGKTDQFMFNAGVSSTDIVLSRTRDDLTLTISDTGDSITIIGYFVADSSNHFGEEKIKFADGTVWDFNAIKNQFPVIATDGNDIIFSYDIPEVIDAGLGNDTVYAHGGDDAVNGGAGNDSLFGEAGNDTLDGGAGNDYLQGGAGNDTYVFGRGSGQDTVYDYNPTVGKLDKIQITSGVMPADVQVRRDSNNLYLSISNLGGTTDRLTVQDWFSGDAFKVEQVVFEDDPSTVWDVATLFALANAPTENADYIGGTNYDDVIYGLGGNDNINGGVGNDTLDGGPGNDSLQGDAGNDTYVFGRGSGQDTIDDYDTTTGNLDKVQIASGVMPADIKITRDQINLYLSINNPDGTTDKLTLQNWFSEDAYKVEQVVFADDPATVWDVATLAQMSMIGTEEADTLYGTSGDDVINGLGGNDTLLGGDGNDILDGGTGNDVLYGGNSTYNGNSNNGNDIYLFGRGSGQDTVIDYDSTAGNVDTVRLDAGVSPDDVSVYRDGYNLCLGINGTSDKLTIQNWFAPGYGSSCRIEQAVFGDGTVWGMDELSALAGIPASAPGIPLGTTGDDLINGTDANDSLQGNAGNDTLSGVWGDDYLVGGSGDDLLDGGAGNDSLLGGGGSDTLDGGNGNDYLLGGSGNDTYLFRPGAGQDTVIDFDTTAGNVDTIKMEAVLPSAVGITRDVNNLYLSINNTDGMADRLTLQNWFGGDANQIERVIFDDGTVWGLAMLGSTPLLGSDSNDYLSGNLGNDVINGNAGDDTLRGIAGNDMLNGGYGNDTLWGGDGNDTLDGGAGNDVLYGGNEWWNSGIGNDTYLFGIGSGQDTVIDYDMKVGNIDTVRFAADVRPTDVTLTREQSNLCLSINGTTDRLTLQNWFGGDASQIERVIFDDGTVWDVAKLESTPLLGLESNDRLYGDVGDDVIKGMGGNDSLLGYSGNDMLDGGAGNDYLQGDSGNDTLDGGIGNDTLYGGNRWNDSYSVNSNDTYIFGRGYGYDTVIDYDTTVENVDTVRIGGDVLPSEVGVTRDQYNLYLGINGTADRLTLQNWFNGEAYKIEQVVFEDAAGTVWDVATLNSKANPAPTEGADQLYGNGSDIVNGLGGNDTLIGSDGNDVLDGGAGNDYLQGGAGNDTYVFGRGFGQDAVLDYDLTAGNLDKVQIASGVSPGDVKVTRGYNDLYLSINNPDGTTDRLTLRNWYPTWAGDDYKVEQVVFADDPNTVWDEATLSALANTPTEAADALYGTDGNDVLAGLGGNDTLFGDTGNDTLDGGTGNDTLYGGTGNDTYLFNLGGGQDTIYEYDNTTGNLDTIRFGAGIAASDIIFGLSGSDLILAINGTTDRVTIQNWKYGDGYHIERVEFADGTAWDTAYIQAQAATARIMGTSGNDYLYGNAGDNTLEGGAGNDYLIGWAGNDTYLFNLGDGQDRIYDQSGSLDTIRFGVGIAASAITFARNGYDLVLNINGTTDQLTIRDWGGEDTYPIERVEFADGTVWGAADLPAQLIGLPVMGTSGNDYLSGGEGNTVYLFNLGGGQDTISDYDTAAGNLDTIRFGAGIVASDITFARNGNDLVLGINGTTDQLTIQSWGAADTYHIEQVLFADGTMWDAAQIQASIPVVDTVIGSNGNDNLYVWAGETATLLGIGGNDWLVGNSGNDTLDGGTGNDSLQGGYGNDTYLFSLGGGQDTISDYDTAAGNLDTIRFGAGIAASDITFARSGNDLVLGINGSADQLTIQNWGYGDAYRIEQVLFADGMVWNAAYLQAQTAGLPIAGTNGNDYLYGDVGNNTLVGGAGNDTLYGGAGNDTYLFNLGGGQDTISDFDYNAGNLDTIRFSAGIAAGDITFTRSGNDLVLSINDTSDQLKIQNWGNGDVCHIEQVEFADGTIWDAAFLQAQIASLLGLLIVGTDGDDYLQAWSGENANLQGIGGNDSLSGNNSNDTLDGGTGNDILYGGMGNDTYLFNLGGGQDTISDYDYSAGNVDTVQFGTGITASDITFALSGYDLVLSINGNTDQLRIANWGYGSAYRIEQVKFADGMVWDAAYLQAQVSAIPMVGTNGNDNLYGDSGNNNLSGLGGDDTLQGYSGNDILGGGTGTDYLYGYEGNDTYLFNLGDGQDTIADWDYNAGNVDTIQFGEGIVASDITFTRSGNNLVLSINGTTDQLTLGDWGYGDVYHIERMEFADGTEWDTAYIQAQVLSAVTPIVGTDGNDNLSGWSGINDTLQGMGGDDYLSGNDGNDTLDGGAGSDYLAGSSGNDVYVFELDGGQDVIAEWDETSGNVDTIRFGTGIAAGDITFTRSGYDLILGINGTTDQLTIQSWGSADACHIERVEFSDGTSWDAAYLQAQTPAPSIGTDDDDVLSLWAGESGLLQGLDGNDELTAIDGNNTFDGGVGDDYLGGGSGNDVYVFGLGDGQDSIEDYSEVAGNVDTIRFGAGIAASDITFMRNNIDLVLGINGTSDQITIVDWSLDSNSRIEQVEFADGTVWDEAYLRDRAIVTIVGTADDDWLDAESYLENNGYQLNENVSLQGLEGDDGLSGFDGNDMLDGGAGNDYLLGGIGNDIYLFNLGDGQDAISEWNETSGNVDTLRFGVGIAASDITFTRSGMDLVLSINETNDQLTIENWGYEDEFRIERVEFADGSAWDAAYLQTLIPAPTLEGTAGDDELSLWVGENNSLQGMDGNDGLYGLDGNNTLDGGAGNDYLDGGYGNDTYLFDVDGGQDIISSYDDTTGKLDVVQFGAGVLPGNVIVSRSMDDLVLSINGTEDSLTIQNYYIDYAQYGYDQPRPYGVEELRFADGTVWSMAFIDTLPNITGTDNADVLVGTGGADNIVGLAGDDVLMGGVGDDNLVGGTGSELLYGGDGADFIEADPNYTDTVNDLLDGGAGDDDIETSVANDLIIGGTGDDYIYDENGKDVLLFNLGDGQDYYDLYTSEGVLAADAQRTISLGGGVGYSDLAFSRVGDDLILDVGDADSMTFYGWFDTSWRDAKLVKTMQIIAEAMPGYNPESTDPLLTKRIQQFDFVSLANQFEAAYTADPTISTWQLAPYLIDSSLGGSDTLTLGGYMAYQYGMAVDLSELPEAEIRAQLDDASFGVINQSISISINSAPIVNTGLDDQVASQDQLFEFTVPAGAFTDIDNGDVLTYRATLADGTVLPAWLNFDAVTQTFSGTPGAYDLASLSVKVVASDTVGLSANSNFTLAVNAPVFTGTADNDILTGTIYDDTLYGMAGNDVLQGADGNDTLSDTAGNNLFNGGAGTDTLTGNIGNELFIGGTGNDIITTNTGADVIAFNKGDGQDTVIASTGADNTISLGGGINYVNLAMSKAGNDLIFSTGNGDQITMQNWYASTSNHSVANLQIVLDNATYNAASADTLFNQQVQTFDFSTLASNFDQALAANPTLTAWSMTDALLTAHLAGSDTTALGGDLAYQYNLNNSLAGIGLASAQTVMNDANFGTAPQTLKPLAELQMGAVKLG